MKKLIVYYSLEGSTKALVNKLVENESYDVLELKPVKEVSTKGASKYFWGGMQAVMKKKPELQPYSINISDYDMVIFGTPVWAGNITPPIRTFIEKEKINGKKVALFNLHEGGPGKTVNEFQNLMSNNNVISTLELVSVKKDFDTNYNKLELWVNSLS